MCRLQRMKESDLADGLNHAGSPHIKGAASLPFVLLRLPGILDFPFK